MPNLLILEAGLRQEVCINKSQVIGGGYNIDNQKVIFAGYFVRHWGHFLMDCLGRSWALLDERFKDYKVAYLTRNGQKIDGNYKRFFDLLGVAERMIDVQQPTMFSEVIIPINLASEEYHSPLFFEPFRYVGRKVSNSIEVPDKVYFSRLHFSSAKNKEIGERVIQNQFERNGFTVMYPEELSLDEQIAVFNKSETVVCVNGTIPLNIMFANQVNTLLVLNKMSLEHMNLSIVCKRCGVEPIYVNVYKEPIKGHPSTMGGGPFWMVFNDDAKKFFDDYGLIYQLPSLYRLELLLEHVLYVFMYIKIKSTHAIRMQLKKVKVIRQCFYKCRKFLGSR